MSTHTVTSEAGLVGHPDKIADRIGDAVLDECLRQDRDSRVGCQVMVARNTILIGGQITTKACLDLDEIARRTVREIGYVEEGLGFDADSCEVLVRVDPQDRAIGRSVDAGGAGDSAIVFGFAVKETPSLMPLPSAVVHGLARKIDRDRRAGLVSGLRPDGKLQASASYPPEGSPSMSEIVLSIQHEPGVDIEALSRRLWSEFVSESPQEKEIEDAQLLLRRSVRFTHGGPRSDCGLSGRKVISDMYGSSCRHGGGGLSGKDPSKIDRLGAYLARYMAKNIVAAGAADSCEVMIAYMIGRPAPVGLSVNLFGTGVVPAEVIVEAIRKTFPTHPREVIEALDLRRPIYSSLSTYGHFGHDDVDHTWERTDRVEMLAASF